MPTLRPRGMAQNPFRPIEVLLDHAVHSKETESQPNVVFLAKLLRQTDDGAPRAVIAPVDSVAAPKLEKSRREMIRPRTEGVGGGVPTDTPDVPSLCARPP